MTLRTLLVLPLIILSPGTVTFQPPESLPGTAALQPLERLPKTAVFHPLDTALESCDPPIRWQLTELDPRFDLNREEATDAIRRAAILWAEAAGRPLLFQEGADGVAIRFLFDEQLAEALALQQTRVETGESALLLAASEAALDELRAELNRHRTVHEQRSREFQQRLAEHSRTVEAWNQAGGAPPEEYSRLLSIEQALDREREAVNQSAEELNRLVGRVNEGTESLNREIRLHNERMTSLHQESAEAVRAQPAEYREVRRGFGPFSTSVDRELDVFHFGNRDHLVRLLAWGLGRVLGLEGSEVTGSIMSLDLLFDGTAGAPELHPSDVERILAICASA